MRPGDEVLIIEGSSVRRIRVKAVDNTPDLPSACPRVRGSRYSFGKWEPWCGSPDEWWDYTPGQEKILQEALDTRYNMRESADRVFRVKVRRGKKTWEDD